MKNNPRFSKKNLKLIEIHKDSKEVQVYSLFLIVGENFTQKVFSLEFFNFSVQKKSWRTIYDKVKIRYYAEKKLFRKR